MKEKVIIDWQPDKTSDQPVYQQIIEYICQKVSSGHWTVGNLLPSQRELSQLWHLNRSTITLAFDELKSYGLIDTAYGRGSRIASNTWSLFLSSKTPDWKNYLQKSSFQSNLPAVQTINRLEADPSYIRLGTGELEPAMFPHEELKEVLNNIAEDRTILSYLEPLGLLPLREALADHLAKRNIKVTPRSILITSGSLQALHLISVGLLPEKSLIFTESPSYLKSLQVFQSAGLKLSGIPMDENGIKYWLLNRAQNGMLLYTIPSFHNPTGCLMSDERRRDLLAFCQKERLPIIEDSAYSELWFEKMPPLSLKSQDEHGMVLYLGTISKTMAPGLRLGWIVGPESVIERLGDIKMQTDYGASSLSQCILNEFLRTGLYEKHLLRVREQLRIKRDNALNTLERYFSDIATWNKPDGGFYIWLKLKQNISCEKLFQKAIEEKILLNPGMIYDFQENYALRLSYSYCQPKEFTVAAKKLADMIRKLIKGDKRK